MDQTARTQIARVHSPAFESGFDFGRTQVRDFYSHEAIAEIGVILERFSACTLNGLVLHIHAVCDHRCCSVRLRSCRCQDAHAVSDAKAEAPSTPAARREAAHGHLCCHFEIAVECRDFAPLDAAEIGVQADAIALSRREMQCDVATVVDVCARDRGVGTKEGDQLVGNCPGDSCHWGDELRAMRPACFEHAAGNRALEVGGLLDGLAEYVELTHEFHQDGLEPSPGKLDCVVDRRLGTVRADDQIDRAVLEMPAAVGETGTSRSAPGGVGHFDSVACAATRSASSIFCLGHFDSALPAYAQREQDIWEYAFGQ